MGKYARALLAGALPEDITQAQLHMDLQKKIATCPQGHQAQNPSLIVNTWSFHFSQKVCVICSLRARCCTGKGGRTVGMNIHYHLVQAAYLSWCGVMVCE